MDFKWTLNRLLELYPYGSLAFPIKLNRAKLICIEQISCNKLITVLRLRGTSLVEIFVLFGSSSDLLRVLLGLMGHFPNKIQRRLAQNSIIKC